MTFRTLYLHLEQRIPLALILKHFNDPIAQVLEDMRKEKVCVHLICVHILVFNAFFRY